MNTVNINIEKIHPFEGHPFKVKDDEEMNALIDSIQQQGILSPLIIRPKENTADEYEIVSGYRRYRAAVKAGMKEVPAFIMPLDRDAAIIALVDSNLHRSHILPSEKAFAYKMKAEAMKRYEKRNLGQVVPDYDLSRTTAEIGKQTSESYKTVQRYIRLTELIPPILEMVDDGRIAFTPAVELSYLADFEQRELYDAMQYIDATPNLSQAQRMREISRVGNLSCKSAYDILSEEKANQKERIKIPAERVRKYFPTSYTASQIEDKIVSLCEAYHRKRVRDQQER